jgi:hypothetical protein
MLWNATSQQTLHPEIAATTNLERLVKPHNSLPCSKPIITETPIKAHSLKGPVEYTA